MNKEINIYVTGLTNTGKSRLSYALKEFLKERGFEVEVTDSDFTDEKSFDRSMRNHLDECIEKIRKNAKINLSFLNDYLTTKTVDLKRGKVSLKVNDRAIKRKKKIDEILK
jgi:adenylylsulfate kinase-like enzyme